MPTGVAFTIPATPTERGGRIVHQPAPLAETVGERLGAVRVPVVDQNACGTEVEQGRRHGAARTPGPNQQDRLTIDAAETFLESEPETGAVGIVTLGSAIAIDGDCVHRPDRTRLIRQLVEKGQHGFLARVGDVDAGKAGHAHGAQQILEPPVRQLVQIHQVVVAANTRCGERVLVQRRRQRLGDVGAD